MKLLRIDGQLQIVHHNLATFQLGGAQDTHSRFPWVGLVELLQHVLNHFVVDLLRVCK